MYNLGYRVFAMTPAEITTYAKVPQGKQKQWLRDFMPADIQARLEPLMQKIVPRLPAYEPDAPLADGAIRISNLTLAESEIRDKGVVVKGSATRRRTAVLVTPIETKEGAVHLAADPGTVFHLVDYRPQKEPLLRQDGATWCGPMRQMAAGNVAKDFYCFTGRDYGYEVYRPSGKPWLSGPLTNGLILPLYQQPIKLEERAEDDLGSMDLDLRVVAVESSRVLIAAEVRHGGETVRLWLRRIRFEKNVAVLPLWDAKLTLTRQANKSLKAELSHDGDGKDWRAGDLSPYLFTDPVSAQH